MGMEKGSGLNFASAGNNSGKVIIDGDNANLNVKGGEVYKFGVIDELTLTTVATSDNESVIYFTTDSTFTFTDNSGIRWGNGNELPTFEANTVYCIVVRNGLAEFDSFGTAS